MRVLYLVPQPKAPDRLATYSFLDEEIHALAARGVEAFVLTAAAYEDGRLGEVHLRSSPARATLGSRLGAALRLLKPVGGLPIRSLRFPLRCYRSTWVEHIVARIVRDEQIDVVHSHFAWPQGVGGSLVKALTGVPLVASLRGTDILVDRTIRYGRQSNALFSRALARLLHDADRTIYFSEFMREEGIRLGARAVATRVVRKGVDLRHFAPVDDPEALRESLGLGRRPMVLTVAGLIPRKGIHHILQAIATVSATTDCTLVVCGDGPERARLEALAASLGIANRVVFAGRVPRDVIPRYFAACDVFVLASLMEAAGNVLFEAMASSKPVVCTDSGGPGEYVVDGETGFVVPVGDETAMAVRIEGLLRDGATRARLGEEARRRTIEAFDYDRMVSEIIDIYREVTDVSTKTPAGAA